MYKRSQLASNQEYDERRTRRLKAQFQVRELIRFSNDDVLRNIEGVVLQIREAVLRLS